MRLLKKKLTQLRTDLKGNSRNFSVKTKPRCGSSFLKSIQHVYLNADLEQYA